jgi:hypothetical protein
LSFETKGDGRNNALANLQKQFRLIAEKLSSLKQVNNPARIQLKSYTPANSVVVADRPGFSKIRYAGIPGFSKIRENSESRSDSGPPRVLKSYTPANSAAEHVGPIILKSYKPANSVVVKD